MGMTATLADVAAGLLVWTVIEYAMHRFAFHGFAPHSMHHDEPADECYIVAPWWLPASGAALMWGLTAALSGSAYRALGMLSGVLVGYALYEFIHLRIHSRAHGGALLRSLRRHHFHHHFQDEHVCFGVTSPIWDLIFQSLPKHRASTRTRVPAR